MGTPDAIKDKLQHLVNPWEYLGSFPNDGRTYLSRAEGIYLYDNAGNKLIDGPAGMWCVQVGYGRRELADAMADQAMQLAYFSPWGLGNEPTNLLAAKLAELSPGDLNTVVFTTGGSTAVDTALRFVHFYNNVLGRPQKKHIISREAGYHGSTYLAASCTGKDRTHNHFDFELATIHRISSPNPYRRPDGMTEEAFCQHLLAELEAKILEIGGADKAAAFIAEPIMASGGVIVPPKGYFKGCRDICTKYDMLFIADEVVTAFGRLGHWFASEAVFGVVPDIITCAKGLTSGYIPMGAALFSDRLVKQITGAKGEGVTFFNGFTYSGHPVAAAVALKNIEIMEKEHILEHVREISPYFLGRLNELRDIPIVGDVRGEGLMACVECVLDKESKDALKLDLAVGKRIDQHCQALGLLVRPLFHCCVMSPPLIITKPQIDEMVGILREGITRAMEDVRREGLWAA